MKSKYILQTAVIGLKTNKSRSALTILGIVIGITSIILMVSIGDGAEQLILGEIAGLGAETIVVRPGREPSGPTDLTETLFSDSLKERDVTALLRKENVPDLVDIMPVLAVPGTISFEGETYRGQILGGSAEFFAKTFDIYPFEGVVFDEQDIRTRASVAVIGSKVRNEFFGDGDALGKQISIRGRKFRVVGIFPAKGQVAFLNINDMVVVPYTTAQTYLLGINHFHEFIIKTTNPDAVAHSVEDIERTLRISHNITDPDKDDFYVETQQGLVEQIGTILGALTIFLSSVVAIALVVGGVGVMNIMLVSVTERTREIGLRKALGATNEDILRQFLLEAIILTGIGGLVGIFLGAFFAFLASVVLTTYAELAWAFTFSVPAALLGLSVSALVGLVFGIYPARKAARKSPIEALRYE
ncbi:MAG: ABC transporter permease [Candidatus Ryanbacteria bacterium CG10_big_fil_rev_8_21_14_0_10_43_42]|uniref:ABC transporter permease n=1 Tax=Candidatus Ryanbacteria bacterium CG10_big_fil_rev_8_21_14_0_10_43_42 TaxID=1974864 RepID=A0A2M8KWS9_9BACT|nr:MAG: ABC transporter permease [Candidatus Ryanbacteria bacterium CG10_big_fil_rev_8_21_14_0_10_43_42]